MRKKLDNVQKVCYAYMDANGEPTRTRFFKKTSKYILRDKKKALEERGKQPVEMTRKQWEIKHGPINQKRSAPAPYRDVRFVEKTYEMKFATKEIYRRHGKPLAY